MRRFPRGSEWRKWDLHLHPPGTKLNNQYGNADDPAVWERFCRTLEQSDVDAFGITDYFSFDGYFRLRNEYQRLYPYSEKVFFPNVELRLVEAVNGAGEEVNLHLIFRPDISEEVAQKFLSRLRTQCYDPGQIQLTCADLKHSDFGRATVLKEDIAEAVKETFGRKVDILENVLVVTSCKGDGLRPTRGARRKENLSDEIDKFSHAFFGNQRNVSYFLNIDRLEGDEQVAQKPVFGGCDAHHFTDLDTGLGKHVREGNTNYETTWIKADLTFEGLQQTYFEPQNRVKLQAVRPDRREPYQYISRVSFTGTEDFPSEVVLNQNLVSIIGARSSGKSSLLAYIAHAVDPENAIEQQVATGLVRREDAGPAAGMTWDSVKNIVCKVEWGDPAAETGRVIYIPQNSLYAISERPEEITSKIQPALFRRDTRFAAIYRQVEADIQACNKTIRSSVNRWFELTSEVSAAVSKLRELGDKKGVESTYNAILEQIATLRDASHLTAGETETYQRIVSEIGEKESRAKRLAEESDLVAPYVSMTEGGGYVGSELVQVRIDTTPSSSALPSDLESEIVKLVEEARSTLTENLRRKIGEYRRELEIESSEIGAATRSLRLDNEALIAKYRALSELDALVQSSRKQETTLAAIATQEGVVKRLQEQQLAEVDKIKSQISDRGKHISELFENFGHANNKLDDGITIGIEIEFSEETKRTLSQGFNMRDHGPYLDKATQTARIEEAQDAPSEFLLSMFVGTQRIRAAWTPDGLSADVLCATPEIRFFAVLDGDRIGGFQRSSMTPGKQALFAPTLILEESPEAWPLLIDQPEDDLDSRSVYDNIVPYLVKRKSERQILMVSHNANLVVGADSEQVIIANRHDDDRKNLNGRMFDYLSGSLEHSEEKRDVDHVLSSCGIREHACEVLDGGPEAFRKRSSKYKV
ncbi:hypothetical protein SAMN05421835_110170 [Amycolatopsis sacchari]|uniref:AAA domain-containing protein n=1 Tax=Amycolatopsis sacchari TaxID=115433 RepID=A0A1I3V6G5_9PSEU|nr:hypothetical protein [Amycolatopsis sacchari]SFJ91018.1 hypothetical protein SAMN05421835_110170 [Amycolatopsis sacchari]